jgi:hypothetical protein
MLYVSIQVTASPKGRDVLIGLISSGAVRCQVPLADATDITVPRGFCSSTRLGGQRGHGGHGGQCVGDLAHRHPNGVGPREGIDLPVLIGLPNHGDLGGTGCIDVGQRIADQDA